MNALNIIDPQNDFCPSGVLAVEVGDEIIIQINDMMNLIYLFLLKIGIQPGIPALRPHIMVILHSLAQICPTVCERCGLTIALRAATAQCFIQN